MANPLRRKIIFIHHSQKLVDEQVISMFSAAQYWKIEYVNLANTEISLDLLTEVTVKLPNWQRELLDGRYMDRSIKNPEREFLLMNDPLKILFLKKNSWLIGTPLIIDNENVFRFHKLSDAVEWLKAKRVTVLKDLTNQSIEVPSPL